MKKQILSVLILVCIGLLSGQTWIRSYSSAGVCPYPYDSGQGHAYNVIPAIGGGYLLQGHVEFTNDDYLVCMKNIFWKIDENGNQVWRRTGSSMTPYSIVVSNGVDRYYCFESGWNILDVYDSEMTFLGRYDLWEVSEVGAIIYDVVLTNDGFVLAAYVNQCSTLIKTDFEFNLIWQGDFVVPPQEGRFEKLEIHNNGSYIAFGYDIIANYTPTGDTLWTVPRNVYLDSFYAMTLHSNGLIYVMNRAHTIDECTIKVIDINGTCINEWDADLPDEMIFDTPVSMLESTDGNLVVYMSSSHPLNKLSLTGTSLWTLPYPVPETGYGTNNILRDNAGNFIFCGGGSLGSFTLIKTNSEGIVANNDPQHSPPAQLVKHYPNPAKAQITIDYKSVVQNGDLSLEIFNLKGQKVYASPLARGEATIRIDLLNNPGFSPGIYLYRVTEGERTISSNKFVFVK